MKKTLITKYFVTIGIAVSFLRSSYTQQLGFWSVRLGRPDQPGGGLRISSAIRSLPNHLVIKILCNHFLFVQFWDSIVVVFSSFNSFILV